MKKILPVRRPSPLSFARTCVLGAALPLLAAACYDGPRPLFENGEAQVVPEFADSATWVRHELWVETDFDSDGDGASDRVHVDVTRPAATESGLEVAVIYETSPYYSGTGGLDFDYFWDIRQEVGAPPPPRTVMPSMEQIEEQPVISNSHIATWVPRGFAVVHSQSPGTGQSQGCPTVGGENESLAPKAVIDWLNGRARGFTAVEGGEEVSAYWSTGSVGMIGTSYNGTLPLAAATTGVEGLEAIIPVARGAQHVVLPLLPVAWAGAVTGRLPRRGHRRPLRLHQQRPDGAPRLLQPDRAQRTHAGALRPRLRGLQRLLGRTATTSTMSTACAPRRSWRTASTTGNVMPEHSYRIVAALRDRGVPVQAY